MRAKRGRKREDARQLSLTFCGGVFYKSCACGGLSVATDGIAALSGDTDKIAPHSAGCSSEQEGRWREDMNGELQELLSLCSVGSVPALDYLPVLTGGSERGGTS